MLQINAGERRFAIKGIVLDKDGTLLDLHHAWGPRTVTWVNMMAGAAGGPPEMARDIFRLIGFDEAQGRAVPDGPFVSATETTLVTLAAGVLCQYGHTWTEAAAAALAASHEAYGAPLRRDEVRPLGDVAGTVRRLRQAGVPVAVATADLRHTTEQSLDHLDIAAEVDLVLCSDDPLPQKPDAALLAWIAAQWGCRPQELLMVGDSVTDMLTGHNGGAAGTVAIVPPGQTPSVELRRYADVILTSIADLSWA